MDNEIINCCRGSGNTNPHVWMVWFINTKNLVGIYSIASTSRTGLHYRKLCLSDPSVVRAWIEEREIDHLFGAVDMIAAHNFDRRELHSMAEKFPLDNSDFKPETLVLPKSRKKKNPSKKK